MSIKQGSIVTFSNPTDEGVGDYAFIFKVLEMRGDRALVEQVWGTDTIRPTFVYFLEDLRPSFTQHPDVEVPAFIESGIENGAFVDTSWKNDETASVEQRITRTYNLKVWVFKPEDYPEGEQPARFSIAILHNVQGWMTQGKDADTEEEAQEIIKSVLENHTAFIQEMGWC